MGTASETRWTADPDPGSPPLQRTTPAPDTSWLRMTGARAGRSEFDELLDGWRAEQERASAASTLVPAVTAATKTAGAELARGLVRGGRLLGQAAARFGLGLGALGAGVAAAFTVGTTAGLAATAVALFAADKWVNG